MKVRELKNYFLTALLAIIFGSIFIAQNTAKEIHYPQADQVAELFANQTHDDLAQTYLSAIDSAQNSILLIVYSLTDPEIISTLRSKSLQGIDVKVICDAKASPYVDSKLGTKVSTTRRYGPGLMHQKILVIDNKSIWLGSANMTTESLNLHGNLVAAVESPAMAETIMAKASTLKVEGKASAIPFQEFMIGNQKVELWFLPDNRNAVRRLKELIRSAEKTIRVAMFTWTRQDLAHEIIRAKNRGIDTEVAIDHYSAKGASAKIVKLLKDNGVPVLISRGGPLLHHKFLYIDNYTLVNGSANWTKAAFTQNDDCFIVAHKLTPNQQACMDSLWHAIASESIK